MRAHDGASFVCSGPAAGIHVPLSQDLRASTSRGAIAAGKQRPLGLGPPVVPFYFGGRVPLLKQTTEQKKQKPIGHLSSNLSTGGGLTGGPEDHVPCITFPWLRSGEQRLPRQLGGERGQGECPRRKVRRARRQTVFVGKEDSAISLFIYGLSGF